MDLATILGLVVAFGGLLVGLLMEGGSLAALFGPSALVIIIGGTIGATMISFPMKAVVKTPKYIMQAFQGKEPDAVETIEALVSMAEVARREGLLALENKESSATNALMAHGLRLAADAMSPEQIEEILGAEMAANQRENKVGAAIMEAAGGYSPTMGIIGTVMGLIHVLGNIENTDELAYGISVAFLATLYGIAFANLAFLPLAGKLKHLAQQQRLADELVMEGILSIVQGVNPRMVRDKLKSMANVSADSVTEETTFGGGGFAGKA